MINLEDRSEAGWAIVEEYEVDDLADNSEDERRMEKAEGKAEKKLAKKCKLKEAKVDFGAKPPVAFGMSQPFPATSMEAARGAGAPPKPAPRFPSGTCFECGDAGHWRQECPKVAGGNAYPSAKCSRWGLMGKVLKC